MDGLSVPRGARLLETRSSSSDETIFSESRSELHAFLGDFQASPLHIPMPQPNEIPQGD